MIARNIGVGTLLVVLTAGVFAQTGGPRRDGNWQVTVQIEMPGMEMPPMTMTQCVTEEDAADPTKSVPRGPSGRGGTPPDCTVSDFKTEGNKISYAMSCEGQMPMTGTGEFTYAGDSYSGVMKMTMQMAGKPMSTTTKYSAKRLGDCTK